jgi:putative transposase
MPENLRKTFKYKLKPTPEQERELEGALDLCCRLYNAALEHLKTAYERCHVSVTRYGQEAELKDIRAEFPEYADIHSHVLQDVLARLDKAFQAFFRRLKSGETPGYPRFRSRSRYNSLTYKEFGNGASLDNGFLVLSKIGRIALRWSHPLEGTPKTVTISREADGYYACFSCADVPAQPLPPTGQETGIDVGLASFATLSNGEHIFNPRWYRKAERRLKTAQRCVCRRKKGAIAAGRRSRCWLAHTRRCSASGRTSTTRKPANCLPRTTRSISKTCRWPTWCGTTPSRRASRMPAGRGSVPSSKPRQYAPGIEWSPCHLPTPARTVAAVGGAC